MLFCPTKCVVGSRNEMQRVLVGKIGRAQENRYVLPKKYGGLNIKRCKLWNITAVGKLLW